MLYQLSVSGHKTRRKYLCKGRRCFALILADSDMVVGKLKTVICANGFSKRCTQVNSQKNWACVVGYNFLRVSTSYIGVYNLYFLKLLCWWHFQHYFVWDSREYTLRRKGFVTMSWLSCPPNKKKTGYDIIILLFLNSSCLNSLGQKWGILRGCGTVLLFIILIIPRNIALFNLNYFKFYLN